MSYNELEQRGTADFPVEYFYIDDTHPRYQMSAHWHGEVELIRVLSGELSVSLDGRGINYLGAEGAARQNFFGQRRKARLFIVRHILLRLRRRH